MIDKKFLRLLEKHSLDVKAYCEALDWDYDKFRASISDEGIAHPDLYLEEPNAGIIDKLSQFLDPSNQGSVFIVWDKIGMGKSSLRDYVHKSLKENDAYIVVLLTDPRLTSLQILRVLAGSLGLDLTIWNDRSKVKEALWKRLVKLTEEDKSIVLWIDEAEKVNMEIISELRALSDLKTDRGLKVCKLILSGTPTLMQKIEEYIKIDPEDAAAFDDRASMNTYKLNPWKPRDVFNYWKLISDYCGGKNPFTAEAAGVVHTLSEGKPRTIAQITRMVINLKASKHLSGTGDLEIIPDDVVAAVREYSGE